EGGASFMAESYAKSSGNVGVCMATRCPGATNLSIGIHTAKQDSTPLVALIGQVERTAKNKEAFQEIYYVSFFKDICKWKIVINQSDGVYEIYNMVFHIVKTGRSSSVVFYLTEYMLQVKTKKGVKESKCITQYIDPNSPNVESLL